MIACAAMPFAPSADVAGYLGSASYDEISDLRTDPFDYSLTRRGTGGDLSAAPTDQGFWTAQSSGPGTQALTWDLKPGTYTIWCPVDGHRAKGMQTTLTVK